MSGHNPSTRRPVSTLTTLGPTLATPPLPQAAANTLAQLQFGPLNSLLAKPWCLSYQGGRPTEDWIFTSAYSADSAWNASYFQHERFNQILLQARGELDTSKRREVYYGMQEIASSRCSRATSWG